MWPGQYIYLRKGVPDLCELTTQAMSKDELIVEPLSSDSQLLTIQPLDVFFRETEG